MRLGANRNTFSFDSRFDDGDGDGDGDGDALFFFFDGVFTAPLPLPFGDDTSLSSDWAANAAFCLLVLALMLFVVALVVTPWMIACRIEQRLFGPLISRELRRYYRAESMV